VKSADPVDVRKIFTSSVFRLERMKVGSFITRRKNDPAPLHKLLLISLMRLDPTSAG
jgi:hypothetical protein